MRFLVIDTCTERGMIVYGSKNEVLFAKELPFGLSQSKFLLPYLMEALRPYGKIPELAAIGTGMGPGSYTGIRMGVAAAQALAYSWKVPLIGVSSLEGFIPSEPTMHFAAILDARIGGVYFQKGKSLLNEAIFEGEPQVCPLEDLGNYLEETSYLVSPNVNVLQAKLQSVYPHSKWVWEERAPSAIALLQAVECKHSIGETVILPEHLNLLYLRQTEAEREKLKNKPAVPSSFC